MEIVLVLGLVYVAYISGALAPFGIAPNAGLQAGVNASPIGLQPNASFTAPPGISLPSQTTGVNLQQVGKSGFSGATGIATGIASGSALGAATAGVGALLAIGSALWAAHEQRKKQAINENAAVNVGVQGFDQDIRTVNAAYNSRQLDAASTLQLLQQVITQYWNLVAPVIQPGRNGCGAPNASCASNAYSPSYCSGSIGAACCVGCADLQRSINEAVTAVTEGGGTSYVWDVYPSKYGAVGRKGYTLTWQQSYAA